MAGIGEPGAELLRDRRHVEPGAGSGLVGHGGPSLPWTPPPTVRAAHLARIRLDVAEHLDRPRARGVHVPAADAARRRPDLRQGAPRAHVADAPACNRSAMTVGFVILSSQPVTGRLLAHERWHIRQFCAWGPLFIPVYFLLAIPYGYRRHPMEIRAQIAAGERPRPGRTRASTSDAASRPRRRALDARRCDRPHATSPPIDVPTTDPGDHVAGVVHARMHPRVADRRGRAPRAGARAPARPATPTR